VLPGNAKEKCMLPAAMFNIGLLLAGGLVTSPVPDLSYCVESRPGSVRSWLVLAVLAVAASYHECR
jgi:hypothetical protein